MAGELYRRNLRRSHSAIRDARDGTARVPAVAALAHIAKLRAVGVGWSRLAEMIGRSQSWILALQSGKRTTLAAKDEQSILAIPTHAGVASDHDTIPARGATRRLQALVARGHSAAELARRLGMSRANLSPLLHGTQPRVAKRRFAEVYRLYGELWDQRPSRATREQKSNHSRALGLAAKHGWVPPLAWDDIDRDVAPPVVEAA